MISLDIGVILINNDKNEYRGPDRMWWGDNVPALPWQLEQDREKTQQSDKETKDQFASRTDSSITQA